MSWVGPIRLAAHEQHDEEYEELADYVLREADGQLDEHRALVEALHYTSPLYEVMFEFYVNTVTHRYVCTKVDLGGDPRTIRHLGDVEGLPLAYP